MPKVSIIVPIYNTAKFLPRCIDSILAQTFIDFELILVNDGSKDNSGNICDEYAKKDSRIVVIHQENGGVSSARDKGLDVAQGEWISFVDSDDFVSHNYISTLFNETSDLTICGVSIINENTLIENRIKPKNELINSNYIAYKLKKLYSKDYFISPCAKLFRAAIIYKHNLRFREKIIFAEDALFVYEYIKYARCILLKSNMIYNYYISGNIHTKFKLDAKKTLFHLEYSHQVVTKLEEKFGERLEYIKEWFNLCYFNKFIAHLNDCEKLSYIEEAKLYRKYNLFRYRPKLSWKELTYLWLKIHLPKIFYKLEHKN